MVPMVMKIIKETEDDELREGVLQLFEALYSRCSDELTEFMDSINAVSCWDFIYNGCFYLLNQNLSCFVRTIG